MRIRKGKIASSVELRCTNVVKWQYLRDELRKMRNLFHEDIIIRLYKAPLATYLNQIIVFVLKRGRIIPLKAINYIRFLS